MIELNVLSIYQLSNFLLHLFISFIITFFFVPFFSNIAQKFNILDNPDGKLKQQKKSIPYLGGTAIFFGFILSLLLSKLIFYFNIYFIIGLVFLIVIGLIDDLIRLKPLSKFMGQIIASLFFLNSLLIMKPDLSYILIPFILVWFLSLINAFNFVDVMDGLATTIAIFSSISFFCYSIFFGNINLALILSCFIGSLIAFLFYNKPSAQIYMGDSGSLFIGGFLSYIPFLLNKNIFVFEMSSIIIPIFILAIPILELVGLVLIRFYKKIPFYLGSPDHFSIYMQQKGWSKYSILFCVTILSIILFFISLFFIFNFFNFITLLLFSLIFIVAWCFLIY